MEQFQNNNIDINTNNMFLKMQNESGTFEILESKVIKDNYVTNCVKKIGPT